MVAGSLLLLLGAYVLGALPFTVALAAANGVDPAEEDLHIALWYRVSPVYAAVAAIVDIAKGAFPVLIGFGFGLPVWVVSFSGVVAVAGQMWPPLRGHGEKGNSTGVGALIILLFAYEAYAALLCLGFFAVGVAMRSSDLLSARDVPDSGSSRSSRVLALLMLAGFASAPLLTWLSNDPAGLTLGLVFMLTAIVVRRLTAGLGRDASVGARIGPVLVRRLLFDEVLVRPDW